MLYYISRELLRLLFIVCFRFTVRHAENYPAHGPFIVASNHLSLLDPPAVGLSIKRQVTFLTRADLFDNVYFNWWALRVGCIPVERSRFDLAAIKGTLNRLKTGGIVVFFPEGTRSKDGILKEPKAGVGFVASKALVPIVPVFIKGTDKALPAHEVCIRFKPVEIRVGKPLYPRAYIGKDGTCDYAQLSKEVMKKIEALSKES